jgi:hypothetical protein
VLRRRSRLITAVVLVFAAVLAMPKVNAAWTTTEVVSTESIDDSEFPSLAVGSDGTIHIAWEDSTDHMGAGADEDIFYKRYVPEVGWTVAEVVSTESDGSSEYPSLAVGLDGTVHIAWDDYTDYEDAGTDSDIFYKRYEPDTGTWTRTQVVSTESTSGSYESSLAVGSDGTVHIAWYDSTDYGDSGTDYDVFYKSYVPDVGWTTTHVVSTESTGNSYYPSLAVGPDGTVHIAWYDYTDYGGSGTDPDIFYRGYEPDTGTWTKIQVVSTESERGSIDPSLAVGSDGTIHIAWWDFTDYGGSGTDRDIFYKRYVPDAGWTLTEVVSTESDGSSEFPSLAVGSDGAVHIAWQDDTDYGDSGTDPDIFYKRFVPPGLALTPDTGFASTTIVGSEFSPNSEITITWDGIPIPTVPSPLITDSDGSFTAIISVPTQTTQEPTPSKQQTK